MAAACKPLRFKTGSLPQTCSMRLHSLLPLSLSALVLAACQPTPETRTVSTLAPPPQIENEAEIVARGEYLVRTSGCNDCHTAGYAERGGKVDKAQWLLGSPLGYNGPWGTTYATNLRLHLKDMTEAQWLEYSANLRTRPIMPDFAVREMTREDRRAIYRFVQSLGPAGEPAPAYLPPGRTPPAPYFTLVLPQAPAAAPVGGH